MQKTSSVDILINEFVDKLTLAVETESVTRARAAVDQAFNGGAPARAKRADPQRKLQGRYMGLIKQVTGKDRERVRALRAAKGVDAAIELMQTMSVRTN